VPGHDLLTVDPSLEVPENAEARPEDVSVCSEPEETKAKPCDEPRLQGLMVRYQQADGAAAVELVECLSPMLYRFLKQQPSTRMAAEDLLQDCWLRIHRSRHAYRPGSCLLPWVFAIARRTRIDGFRRYTRREMRETVLSEELPPAASSSTPDAEARLDIRRHLERLTGIEREVFHLLKVQGLTLEEVSAITGASVTAVKQRAHRAYLKLRLALQEHR
jgi:RNA polymerase sigma-70 factor (ECF subfamily)